MLPHREYDGTTLLTLPERMHGRLLYLLNTEKGNCSRLKQTFEFVLESLLGRSREFKQLQTPNLSSRWLLRCKLAPYQHSTSTMIKSEYVVV